MAMKQTKFETFLEPPEVEAKQSQANFSQHCVFCFQLEQNCVDRSDVRPVICVAKILHAAYIPNDAKQYDTVYNSLANESQSD